MSNSRNGRSISCSVVPMVQGAYWITAEVFTALAVCPGDSDRRGLWIRVVPFPSLFFFLPRSLTWGPGWSPGAAIDLEQSGEKERGRLLWVHSCWLQRPNQFSHLSSYCLKMTISAKKLERNRRRKYNFFKVDCFTGVLKFILQRAALDVNY
jgi:hypothetical protein